MKTTVEIDVEPLPATHMLAFHERVGEAVLDDRTFEVTRSLTSLGFAFHERVNGITVIHTLKLDAVILAALEAIVEADS